MKKVNTTLSIDSGIKLDFKIECARNGVDMSETTEQLWQDYTKLSREIHQSRKNNENGG